MFGVGWAEWYVFAGTIFALTVAWRAWRDRWVTVSREWRVDLPVSDVEGVLMKSFALVPRATWRPQVDGSWLYTIRRVPALAIFFGVLTLPLGLLLFLVKETADLHVRVVADEPGCRVTATGRTTRGTAAALDAWLTRMGQRERL